MDIQKILTKLIEQGISQTEIANYCACTQATISNLLHGKVRNPSFSLGSRIVDFANQRGIQ